MGRGPHLSVPLLCPETWGESRSTPPPPHAPLCHCGWAGQGFWQSYFGCCCGCCRGGINIDALGIPAYRHGEQPAWRGRWGSAEELGQYCPQPWLFTLAPPMPCTTSPVLGSQPCEAPGKPETPDQWARLGLGCGPGVPGAAVLGRRLSLCVPTREGMGHRAPPEAVPVGVTCRNGVGPRVCQGCPELGPQLFLSHAQLVWPCPQRASVPRWRHQEGLEWHAVTVSWLRRTLAGLRGDWEGRAWHRGVSQALRRQPSPVSSAMIRGPGWGFQSPHTWEASWGGRRQGPGWLQSPSVGCTA